MTTLTDEDHRMFAHAAQRGDVVVTRLGRARLATLMAWRPSRNGHRTNTARVRYPTGTFATVKLDEISLPGGQP